MRSLYPILSVGKPCRSRVKTPQRNIRCARGTPTILQLFADALAVARASPAAAPWRRSATLLCAMGGGVTTPCPYCRRPYQNSAWSLETPYIAATSHSAPMPWRYPERFPCCITLPAPPPVWDIRAAEGVVTVRGGSRLASVPRSAGRSRKGRSGS